MLMSFLWFLKLLKNSCYRHYEQQYLQSNFSSLVTYLPLLMSKKEKTWINHSLL